MKKALVFLSLFLLYPVYSNAAITYFAFDDTLKTTAITGFQLDFMDQQIDLANDFLLQKVVQGETRNIGGVNYKGAVPQNGMWDIFKTFTPKKGISGVDYLFSSIPTPGLFFSLEGPTTVSFNTETSLLSMGFGEKVPNVSFLEKYVSPDILVYTASQVPIPSSMLLLGGGLLTIFGLRRRQ